MKPIKRIMFALLVSFVGLCVPAYAQEEPKFSDNDGAVEPFIQDFKFNKDQTIKITYAWKVIKPFSENWPKVFVHFTNADKKIFGGNDHATPSPATTMWKAGEVKTAIADFKIPSTWGEGIYYIRIGMFRDKLRCSDIKGLVDGEKCFYIGKMIVEGKPGAITNVKFELLKGMKQPVP